MTKNWTQIVCVVTCMAALAMIGTQRARTAYSSPVAVTNTPLVTDINENARHAVRLNLGGTSDVFGTALNDATTGLPFTVPAGKRLVIEQASLFAYPPTGHTVFAYWFNGHTFTAVPVTLQQPMIFQFGPTFDDGYMGSVPTRDYVDAGGQVQFTIGVSGGDWKGSFWDVHVIGYLIDCNGEC